MLFLKNARAQGVFRIAAFNWHNRLQHNRPGIQILVHEMNRASGKFHSVIERLLL